jgi:hypothetical protein
MDHDKIDGIEKQFANPLIIGLAGADEHRINTGDDTQLQETYTAAIGYLKSLTHDELVATVMVTAERGADFLKAYANLVEAVKTV